MKENIYIGSVFTFHEELTFSDGPQTKILMLLMFSVERCAYKCVYKRIFLKVNINMY